MVSETKKQLVQDLVKDIQTYPIVALVNMENLPAQQLQNMRAMLMQSDVKIVMTRKRLIRLALESSGRDNIKQLTEKIKGMPALLFSKDNPFTLYATIQKNKSEAPAKAGQEAPRDILVKGGPTNFAPGPIISELAAVGIKTKVDGGKLAIIDDVTVAKEGDIITDKLAETLKRLDIKPMEIGLNLVAVWENGTIFTSKDLHIDEQEYLDNFTQAAQWAVNLAMDCAIPTSDTTEMLLQKAFREAKAVALEQDIINDETKDEILGKVEAQALAVKEAGKIEVGPAPEKAEQTEEKPVEETPAEPEAPKEEVKEEPKAEEKKEESAPKEEVKEEAPAEEPKEEEKPAEPVAEEKQEEPQPEPEQPKAEAPVEEAPKEEEKPVEEPTPEPEQSAEETPTQEESQPAPAEEKQEEPKVEEKPVPEPEQAPAEEEKPTVEPEVPAEEPKAEELEIEKALDEEPKKSEQTLIDEQAPVEPKLEDLPKLEEPKVEQPNPIPQPQFQNDPQLEKPHPKQGNVSLVQAEDLLNKLQKDGRDALRKQEDD